MKKDSKMASARTDDKTINQNFSISLSVCPSVRLSQDSRVSPLNNKDWKKLTFFVHNFLLRIAKVHTFWKIRFRLLLHSAFVHQKIPRFELFFVMLNIFVLEPTIYSINQIQNTPYKLA